MEVKGTCAVISRCGRCAVRVHGRRVAMMPGGHRMGNVGGTSGSGPTLTGVGKDGPMMAGPVAETCGLLAPQVGEGPLSRKHDDGHGNREFSLIEPLLFGRNRT